MGITTLGSDDEKKKPRKFDKNLDLYNELALEQIKKLKEELSKYKDIPSEELSNLSKEVLIFKKYFPALKYVGVPIGFTYKHIINIISVIEMLQNMDSQISIDKIIDSVIIDRIDQKDVTSKSLARISMSNLKHIATSLEKIEELDLVREKRRETINFMIEYPVLLLHGDIIDTCFPDGISQEDKCGGGKNGVILSFVGSEGKNVVKINKKLSSNPKEIRDENIKQIIFKSAIDFLTEEELIADYFEVPKVFTVETADANYFVMQYVEGKTILRHQVEYILEKNGVHTEELVSNKELTDKDFIDLYMQKYTIQLRDIVYKIGEDAEWFSTNLPTRNKDTMIEIISNIFGKEASTEFWNLVEQLETLGLENKDLYNPANIMIDKQGKWHLIDYGMAKISPESPYYQKYQDQLALE